jgi:uncharacterized protein
MYAAGRGTPRNPFESFVHMMKAAAGGRREAQYALGMLYLMGEGYTANPAAATCWLREAARLGDPRAQTQLDNMTPVENTVAPKPGLPCGYPPLVAQ